MPPPRTIRVPLQVGRASLRNAVRGSIFAWTGVVFAILSLGIGPLLNGALAALPDFLSGIAGIVGIMLSGVAALAGLAFALGAREDRKREAPSDLVLDAEGLRVVGGAAGGLVVPWIQVERCQVVEDAKADTIGLRHTFLTVVTLGQWKRAQRLKPRVHRLRLTRRDGREHVLAASDDAEELESLRDLAACVNAVGGEEVAPTATPDVPLATTLLTCVHCAAPLAPADVALARCHHCGQETPVPDDLRARLRAPEEVARGLLAERRIAKVLAQPGVTRATLLLALARWIMLLAWPAALATLIGLALLQEPSSPWYPSITMIDGHQPPYLRDALLAVAVIPLLFTVAIAVTSAYLANRRALRVVSLRFGATPPEAPGAPSTCRACAAPLPERPGRIVVGCVYCGVENVLGTDLRLAAGRARGQERSVLEGLRHRRRARLRLAAALLLSAAAVWLLAHELRWTARLVPARPRLASSCLFCRTAEIHNLDPTWRALTVHDAKRTRTRVIPAGARVTVECEEDCRVDVGASRRTLDDSHTWNLTIHGGALETPARSP